MGTTETLGTLDERIRFAIQHKRLVEVSYKGSTRLAEPHDYGVQKAVERLFVYQLSGPARSSSQQGKGWRKLDTAKIVQLKVLDATFPGSRGRSHTNHEVWDVLYARVK